MATNPNELRALTLLGQEIGRSVVPWPGKRTLPKIMSRYPDVIHPTYSGINDGGCVWKIEAIAEEWRHIVPDGLFIEPQSLSMFNEWNPRCHHVCIVEVETTTKMDEFKLARYGRIWDGFLCESDAWEFHVVVWDWYDQWRELDLHRIYDRSIALCQPERNRHDLLTQARCNEDHQLESEIATRIDGALYDPIRR